MHERLARPPQPRHHRADWHTCHVRDVLVRKLLQFVQNEAFAKFDRQCGESHRQPSGALAPAQGHLRVIGIVGYLKRTPR